MHQPPPPSSAWAGYEPLYQRVKRAVTDRIGSGGWKPGEMLPSEFELAAEYRVSQGPVRKALLALEAERLIVRRQGRGTYVARHSRAETLFHFFRMVGLDGRRLAPTSFVLRQSRQRATREQARQLSLEPGDAVHAFLRVRSLAGEPAILERIFVPVALMPALAVTPGIEMQDEMYVIYQERFGVTIARASERLEAVAATQDDARHLGISQAAPLLEIVRVAYDVNGRAVELRISRCTTSRSRYAAEIF